MFKRLFWFGSGAATGAAGSIWARRQVRRRIEAEMAKFTPGGLRDQAIAKAKAAGANAKIAVGQSREIARAYRENQLEQN